ncbi:Gfo/Idh/MocA family protein [Streptomyces sp. NPDC050560]|uniref:Gfo/Idh/MocA family protein n=1 Tax=Streptomyces sp. NPDC050560 TaxID=3365630 RepID=UPI0037AF1A68
MAAEADGAAARHGGRGADPGGPPIRVGILGASPDRGWAVRAHIPALRALPQYEITAVGTSRRESAEAAARQFGAAHAFTDARRLAEHPEVDLVAVTVKVPAHAELVGAALAAGKHVYCEWPLARDSKEAEALAGAARAAGVHDAIGLQARYAPAVRAARELLAEGAIGRVLSATVYAARGKGAREQVEGWAAYTLDTSNGAGLVEVGAGHTLDALQYVVGDIAELSATLAVRSGVQRVEETGEPVAVTSPDHLLLGGTVADGAVVGAHIHDGKITEGRTRIEVSGTEGDLALVSTETGGPAGLQIGALRLLATDPEGGGYREVPLPAGAPWPEGGDPGAQAHNVARMYAALADDIRTGSLRVPDFAAGVRLHRLLDTVRLSATTGTRRATAGQEQHG